MLAVLNFTLAPAVRRMVVLPWAQHELGSPWRQALTRVQLAGYRFALELLWEDDPATRAHRDLTVQYAERRGGLVLEYWKHARGFYWGRPTVMTDDQISAALNVPPAELEQIWRETESEVTPAWKATPEYAEWKKRYRRGLPDSGPLPPPPLPRSR